MQHSHSNNAVNNPREHELIYNDGRSRKTLVIDLETPYPDGKLIVSRTDKDGYITHINHAFEEMSGFSKEELINQPHYILRHPDMPKAAYRDLWNTVKSGKKWHGYIKNLRKDGGYYLVYATIIPNIRNGKIVGYTSVRRKPSPRKMAEALAQYAQIMQEEQECLTK